MNVIEERIRAAARAAADTVAPDSVPPLELPAARVRRLGRQRRHGRSAGAAWTLWAARLAPASGRAGHSRDRDHDGGGEPPCPVRAVERRRPAAPRRSTPQGYVAVRPGTAVLRTGRGARGRGQEPGRGSRARDRHRRGRGGRSRRWPGRPWSGLPRPGTTGTFVLARTGTGAGRAGTFYQRLAILFLTTAGRVLATGPLQCSAAGDASMTGAGPVPDGTRLAFASQPATSRNEPTLTNVTVLKLAGGASGPGPRPVDLLGLVSWTAGSRTNWPSTGGQASGQRPAARPDQSGAAACSVSEPA